MKISKAYLKELIRKRMAEVLKKEGGPGSGPQSDDDNPFDKEPSDDDLRDIEKQYESKISKLIQKVIAEDFAGCFDEEKHAKFEKQRGKNAEQLGYKLMGTSDVKTNIDNARVHQVGHRLNTEGKLSEDFKNNKWEVYVADERGREKIVKVAKSKRAGVILYNKLIKTDKYEAIGMESVEHWNRTNSPKIKEGKLTESQQVAKTILQQLGGNKFIAMTGAKNFGSSKNSLQFKIGKNSKSISHIIITLKSSDLYDVEFIRMRGTSRKVIKKLTGVYADMLRKIFTKYTGLRTSL